ncbi:MAG: ArsR family transcriptional regulator [Calditrichaeota bacterium]|nr:MAG: ArsR family transcriptional regulator [Calditrichota bacterium]
MQIAEHLKALSDETRLRIIHLLLHIPSMRVMDLVTILGEPQSKVSRHLAYLKRSGWVEDRRVDQWVYYRLSSTIRPIWREALQELFAQELVFETDLKRAREM